MDLVVQALLLTCVLVILYGIGEAICAAVARAMREED